MSTPVENFAKATLSGTYSAGATAITVVTGHGSRFPSTFPYPVTVYNSTVYPDPADDPKREIMLVTNRVSDVFTVTRGQEGTAGSTKNDAGVYLMVQGITKGMWDGLANLSMPETFRGLCLQTFPDSDVADKKVRLVHADAIVMSDGTVVKTWDDIDADITAANGGGGLDTGSEQASTWYEIHAISDGTNKKIMLHRAKDYFLDEDCSAGEDASQGLRSAVDNSTVKVAQGFKIDTAGLLPFLDVKLLKTGTPTGNYWFTIESNNAGVPNNTPIATSRKMSAARLTTTGGWVRIIFDAPATLSAATQYHFVLQADYAVSASNFISWRMDGSAAAYANGNKALFDSDTSTWTQDTDDDLMFKAYITRNDTAVVVPAGYQRSMLGYVYNDGSSNFVPFMQFDKTIMYGQQDATSPGTIAGSASVPVLLNLSANVPPCSGVINITARGTAAIGIIAGDLKCTDILPGGLTVSYPFCVRAYLVSGTNGSLPFNGRIPLEFQAIMFAPDSTAIPYVMELEMA